MATVPEFITILREIRDVIYPDMTAMEARLQAQIDALELRVTALENP